MEHGVCAARLLPVAPRRKTSSAGGGIRSGPLLPRAEQDGMRSTPYYCGYPNLVSRVAWTNWFVRVLRTDRTIVRARSNKFGRGTQSQVSWPDGSPFQCCRSSSTASMLNG